MSSLSGLRERVLLRFSARRRVRHLVLLAHGVAATSLGSFASKWPFLDSVDVSAWDICVTVGIVHFAMVELSGSLSERRWRQVFGIAAEHLDNINGLIAETVASVLRASPRIAPQPKRALPGGLQDCVKFCGERMQTALAAALSDEDKNCIHSDLAGMWVLWNVLGRAPDGEELQAVRAIGLFCSRAGLELAEVMIHLFPKGSSKSRTAGA